MSRRYIVNRAPQDAPFGTRLAASDNRIPPLWWSLGVIVFSIGLVVLTGAFPR